MTHTGEKRCECKVRKRIMLLYPFSITFFYFVGLWEEVPVHGKPYETSKNPRKERGEGFGNI